MIYSGVNCFFADQLTFQYFDIVLFKGTFPAELKQKEDFYLYLRNAAEMLGGSYRQPFPNEVNTSVGGNSGDVSTWGGDTGLNGKELREVLAQKRLPGVTNMEMLFAAQRKKRDGR